MDSTAKQWAKITPTLPADAIFHHGHRDPAATSKLAFPVTDPSSSTIQNQRRELRLLMAELKDRDRELNTMAASHHKQHRTWEQDRQKVLTLEQRCACLNDELQKRNEVIKVLTKRVWVVETSEKEAQKELGLAQQQLCELEEKEHHVSQKYKEMEEKNQSLNSTIMILSNQVGTLQAKEEELSSLVKLKSKEVTDASSHIISISGHVQEVETLLKESRSRESKAQRELEDLKRSYKEARHDLARLEEELEHRVAQNNSHKDEITRLKQELHVALSVGADNLKDELLALGQSKHERNMTELTFLRQKCEDQQNDMQVLQVNLDKARESLRERRSQAAASQDELRCACMDMTPSAMRLKSSGPMHEMPQPTAGNIDPVVFSAQLTDGNDLLSECFLQQLVDESRQIVSRSDHSFLRPHISMLNTDQSHNCGSGSYFSSHKCQQPPAPPAHHHHHHHHTQPTLHKANDNSPKACLRHCRQDDGH